MGLEADPEKVPEARPKMSEQTKDSINASAVATRKGMSCRSGKSNIDGSILWMNQTQAIVKFGPV